MPSMLGPIRKLLSPPHTSRGSKGSLSPSSSSSSSRSRSRSRSRSPAATTTPNSSSNLAQAPDMTSPSPAPSSSSSTSTSHNAAAAAADAALLPRLLRKLDKEDDKRLRSAIERSVNPNGADRPPTTTGFAESISKALQFRDENRYSDIVSYDHALLPGPYLNASFISPLPSSSSSSSSPSSSSLSATTATSYIASQAPTPSTFPSFLVQLVSNRIGVVVNLTALAEGGRVKADRYWPKSKGETFNAGKGWRVTCEAEEKVELAPAGGESKRGKLLGKGEAGKGKWDLTLRRLLLRHQPSSSSSSSREPQELSRTVEHRLTLLHLTTWSDHSSDSAESFKRLIDLVRSEVDAASSSSSAMAMAGPPPPVWVHCSAGVGRSGTLIASLLAHDVFDSAGAPALSSLSSSSPPQQEQEQEGKGEEATEEQRIALHLVRHMRRSRPRMVQSASQLGMVVDVVGELVRRR